MLKLNQKGFTAFEVVIVIVALVAIGVAGYFAFEARQDKTDYSVNAPKKTQPSPSKDPYEGWVAYTSSFNGVAFRYPKDWQINIEPAPAEWPNNGQKNIKLTSPQGFNLYYWEWVSGLGGGCPEGTPNILITKVKELDHTKGVYLAENPGTIALSNDLSKTGDAGSCLIYPQVSIEAGKDPIMFASSIQYAPNNQKFPDSQAKDLEAARLILLSFKK